MNDQNGNGTAAQPAQAAAQPVTTGTGTTQAAAPQYGPDDIQRWQRIEQQWKGAQPFIEKARSSGLKSAEDIDKWAPVFGKIKDHGAFNRAWEPEPQEEAKPLTEQRWLEMMEKREAEKARADAEKNHWSEYDGEMAAFEQAKIDEILKDAPKEFREMARLAAIGKYHSSREPYPEGHPLHGQPVMRPVGKDGLGGIQKMLTDHYSALTKHFQGSHLAAVADAASKPQSQGTPAGQQANSGKPGNNKDTGTRAERTRDLVREASVKLGLPQ